ncbi:MAG: LPS-assembly protein LptD, partial [Candidatus Lightella neohaematopini]|nr:LPS-assembly protein LptD [Candidatus Lightella neohaematopini]
MSFTNNKSPYFGILLPNINYNRGIELNIPYRIFSNFHSYEIIITPSIKQNIFNLKNKFNYLNNNYYGSLEFSFIPSQEKIDHSSWLFYWFNTLKKNNYQLDIIYNKFNYYDFINFLNINDYIKNKIIKKYHLLINNKNFNNDILYEKFLKGDNIYDINSLINFYYYKNLYKKLINFTILGQFVKSTGNINNISKYFYILPKINYIIPTKLGIINSSFSLNTLYKNMNINLNHYNKINNLIDSKYVYIMPEININWYTIVKLFNKNYTQIIKPIINYKYNLLKNKFDFDNLYQDELIYLSNNINKNKLFNHYFFEGFKTLLFNKNIEKLYFSLEI